MPTFHLLLLATTLCGHASASGATAAQANAQQRGTVARPSETGWAGLRQLLRAGQGMVARAWERGNCARNRRHRDDGAPPCVRAPLHDDEEIERLTNMMQRENQDQAERPLTADDVFLAGFGHVAAGVRVDPPEQQRQEHEIDELVARMPKDSDDSEAGADAAAAQKHADELKTILGMAQAQASRDLLRDPWHNRQMEAMADFLRGKERPPVASSSEDDLGDVLSTTPEGRRDDTREDGRRPEQASPESSRPATPDAEPSPDSDPAESGEGMDDAAIFDHEKSPDAETSGDEETPDDDDADSERSWGPEEAETPTPPRPKPKSSSTAIMTASALFAAAVAVAL